MTEKAIRERINRLMKEIYPQLAALRHQIHENPELGGQERQTAQLVMQSLQGWGIPVWKVPDSTAVIGELRGERPGTACIALRAEMDALPVQEASGVTYASHIPGVMHACGHDFNTVNLLGTAWLLQQLRGEFGGTLRLLFQPAEEICGGTDELLAAGALSQPPRPRAILAAHVSTRYALGQIAVREGFINMAASRFAVTLQGHGGHAAAPHRSEDLILLAAELIVQLQLQAGRLMNHIEPGMAVVSAIESDGRGNVLPQTVRFSGTVRAERREIHALYQQRLEALLAAVRSLHDVSAGLEFQFSTPAMYNAPALVQRFRQCEQVLLGEARVLDIALPTNGSENFAEFSSRLPAVYFHIGAAKPGEAGKLPVHSAGFRAEDEAFLTGVPAMAWAALDFLSWEQDVPKRKRE